MNNKVRIRILDDSVYTLKYLMRRNIDIYNIEYSSKGNIYTININDLEKLNADYFEILSYKGMKSIFLKFKIHKHFLLSILLTIVLMVLISNIVVKVDVIHSNKDIRELLTYELYNHNVKPFMLKKSFVNLQKIKNEIKDTHPNEIEWLEIIDDGMKYTVRVEERIITKEEEKKDYCNVISKKDAVILSTVPTKGQMVVSQSDFVKKGSILISGEIKFNEETKSYTCAEGDVYGNTWYRVSVSVPFEHIVKEYTGVKKKNIGIEIGTKYNRIFRVHLDNYDVLKKKIFGLGQFNIYEENVNEYISKTEMYSEKEALEVALEQAKEKLFTKLDDGSEILNEKVLQSNSYDSIMNVDVFYSVKEKISEVVEAVKNEGVGQNESTEGSLHNN